MSFDYDKLRNQNTDNSQMGWGSYSDLFMNLSVIFLMLYVSVSLRTGTSEFQRTQEMQRLQAQTEDYKQQIKVYNTLRDQHLQESASEDEKKVYEELMSKLDLLQEEAKDEKQKLRDQALENEKKEFALNKYQQIIRNIINTNMLAKTSIKRRDQIIVTKDQTLKEHEKTIAEQEREIQEKQALISENEQRVEEINQTLQENIKKLEAEQKKYKTSKKALQEKIAELKNQSEQEVQSIREESEKVAQQLANANADLQKEKLAVKSELDSEKKKSASLEKDLAEAKAVEEAKREIVRKIKDRFTKAGIGAKVDPQTGDITIQFDKEYFDTGSANLKPNMKKILKDSIPLYAKSLMEDQTVAKKLESVEIIGFASPTYQGKYVDPKTLDLKDKAAVNYNLDLSYKRAKSIFNYMTDTGEVSFAYQKELLPLVKVTGRSFLAEGKKGRNPADKDMTQQEFCKVYNCNEAQKVIIKFNLKKAE